MQGVFFNTECPFEIAPFEVAIQLLFCISKFVTAFTFPKHHTNCDAYICGDIDCVFIITYVLLFSRFVVCQALPCWYVQQRDRSSRPV